MTAPDFYEAPDSAPYIPDRMKVRAVPYESTCLTCGTPDTFLLDNRTSRECLDCAGLGYFEFLPSGDAAFTRLVTKCSRRSAVVVVPTTRPRRWEPYERRGMLAEPAAIERAAQQYVSDGGEDIGRDVPFRRGFAGAIREQFPGCPPDRAAAIALHVAARGAGLVERRRSALVLQDDAVLPAIVASVRHIDTDYDALLESGADRDAARAQVQDHVDDVLDAWRSGLTLLDE